MIGLNSVSIGISMQVTPWNSPTAMTGRQADVTIPTTSRYRRAMVCEARFPSKRNCLRCVRCVNENRKKRKRLRWQAANHGCHCYDRAFLLTALAANSDCVWMETGLDAVSTSVRNYEMMASICLSVCMSVACRDLTRKRKT